ncbi:MAG TPA: EamA family transporter [Candidatus Sulfotelmatobacter sp.]|nr:EamA family transporter [Candidatus Sulfotelmatobacter sp.]
MIAGLAYLAAYALLAGFAAFIEVPVGRGYRPFQLNALIRMGSVAAGLLTLFAAHGLAIPITLASLAGVGVGVIDGIASIGYCFAIGSLPISTVATLSNLYLVVTTVMGIALLGESITVVKVAGVVATIAGALLLDAAPPRFAVQGAAVPRRELQGRPLLIMAAYVVLVGLSAFLEKPLLRSLDATELNGFMSIGMAAVAAVALGLGGPRLPMRRATLLPAGVGALIGLGSVLYFLALRGLPVSVAAALSNASIIVTVALSLVFLGQRLTRQRGIAMALTLVGVATLATSVA